LETSLVHAHSVGDLADCQSPTFYEPFQELRYGPMIADQRGEGDGTTGRLSVGTARKDRPERLLRGFYRVTWGFP
jgi:hypothetical protein